MSNQILKELEKGKKNLGKFVNRGTRKVGREITSTVNSVRKVYLKKLDRIREISLDSYSVIEEDLNSKIVNYSSFDLEILGKYIAEIMSLYEGKQYCYQKACLVLPYTDANFIYLVVDEDHKCEFYIDSEDRYTLNTMDKISENGIVFSTYLNSIDFYRIDENASLSSTVDFGKFPYVQKFIDYVISYRIDNPNVELTDELLADLKFNFVSNNVEDICERYGIREQEALDYLEEVRINNDRVDREIDKILKL